MKRTCCMEKLIVAVSGIGPGVTLPSFSEAAKVPSWL